MLPGDRQKAWEHIQAITNVPILAIRKKRQVAREIVERQLLSTEILCRYPTLYAGSHTDVAFPLCLGGRRIDLLDPDMKYENRVAEVREQIEKIIHPRAVRQMRHFDFSFSFDFGEGLEEVTVRCLPQSYLWDEEANQPDAYHPEGPIGMLLAFNPQKIRLDMNREISDQLVKGGAVFVNRRYQFVLLDDDQEITIEAESIMSERKATQLWADWIQEAAKKEGTFRFVLLQKQAASFYYTFLQKKL